MNTTPTVLVLGANGRFGAAAAQAFSAAGWRVLAQVRRAGPHAHPVTVPLQDTAALAAAAQGASVVVYALNPPYTDWESQALPLFRQGLDVARRLGARLLLPGNVYNFGAGMPARLDEATPMRPTTSKGRIRVQMEQALRDSGLDATVIRAGDFFGAGTGSWLDLVIAKDIARGRLVLPGDPDVLHAWAYLPDLARAFVAVAGQAMPGFHDFAFEGHSLTLRELTEALKVEAQALGLQPPSGGWRTSRMPWGAMRVAGLFNPMLRELVRMRYLWQVPHALDGRRLAATVGPLPATPLPLALRRSLQALGHGKGMAPGLSLAA